MTEAGKDRPGGPQPHSARPRPPAELKRIGECLGECYDRVLHEPLPDRVALLLSRLERRERGLDDGR
ncbi:NepR family anti-sigma factor [Tistlia consotensis]|nr:NepR family anti-sigma factor [Tistlia consotensis]